MSQQKRKAGPWYYLRSDFQWLPVSSGSHCRVSCSVQKPPCYGWMFWINRSNYLWAYKTTPENMQWTPFLSILCKIRATPCDSPQLTESDVLIKSGAIFFLFLGHMTPLFSEGTKTRGQGQRSLIFLSSSTRDHQHNTFNNVKVHS